MIWIYIYKIPAMLIVGNVITSSFLRSDLCYPISSPWVKVEIIDFEFVFSGARSVSEVEGKFLNKCTGPVLTKKAPAECRRPFRYYMVNLKGHLVYSGHEALAAKRFAPGSVLYSSLTLIFLNQILSPWYCRPR